MAKKILLILSIPLLLLCSLPLNAQFVFKYESFGSSDFRDKIDLASTGKRGSSSVYSGRVNIPLSVKMKGERAVVWSLAMSGAYASLNNYGFVAGDNTAPIDEILNLNLNIVHMRRLNKRLSIMFSAGVGAFMPDSRLSTLGGGNILGSGGAVLVWHLRPNLDLGGGLALSNALGHPMIMPMIYFNWRLDAKFKVRVSMISGVNILVGYSPHRVIDLNFVMNMGGQMALLKVEGKKMIFSHQYITFGFQPNINISKRISIPLTVGVAAQRTGFYTRRSLKGMFADDSYKESYFKPSLYISVALHIKAF